VYYYDNTVTTVTIVPNLDFTPGYIDFHDTYFVVTSNVANAHVTIEQSTNVYALTFTGHNAWARGRYGLYWQNTVNGAVSHMVNLSNIRFEQGYEGGKSKGSFAAIVSAC